MFLTLKVVLSICGETNKLYFMIDVLKSKRLQKIIFNKLDSDLSNKIYHPFGRELWLLDIDTKEWYFHFTNDGKLWYNQKIFNSYFSIFSLDFHQYQKILKKWFEDITELNVYSISRKNSNMEYFIDGVIRNTNYKWSIKDRYGYSYHIIKKYLSLKSETKNVTLKNYIVEHGIL